MRRNTMCIRRVIIVRGLPSAGKSTLSNKLLKEFQEDNHDKLSDIYSTDDYFIHNGEYKFDGRQLTQAHDWNRSRFERAIRNDYDLIVVDNTNTQFWEVVAYVSVALNAGYTVEFCEPDTPWATNLDELFERNTHKVPYDAIQKMLGRWESTRDIMIGCAEKFGCEIDFEKNMVYNIEDRMFLLAGGY